ncbi:MAG TPA: hypothetical protein VLB69_11430 [Rudaea sp.]|nr:hypothetical protein [Rudaea sp.]
MAQSRIATFVTGSFFGLLPKAIGFPSGDHRASVSEMSSELVRSATAPPCAGTADFATTAIGLEDDRSSVRRPDHAGLAVVRLRELHRPAPGRRHFPQIEPTGQIGRYHDLPAIRRPRRPGVAARVEQIGDRDRRRRGIGRRGQRPRVGCGALRRGHGREGGGGLGQQQED